jgi:hypothetical protein
MNTALKSVEPIFDVNQAESRFACTMQGKSGFFSDKVLTLKLRAGRVVGGMVEFSHESRESVELNMIERDDVSGRITLEDTRGLIRMNLKMDHERKAITAAINHPKNEYLLQVVSVN